MSVKFENTYEDIWGNMTSLTKDELNWFYGIIDAFKQLDVSKGISFFNRDHEKMERKHREALGIFYTNDRENPCDCFVTIDNYFIHECYESVFHGTVNLSFRTLEEVIAHEIAHKYQFRHCKRHTHLAESILHEYNQHAFKSVG